MQADTIANPELDGRDASPWLQYEEMSMEQREKRHFVKGILETMLFEATRRVVWECIYRVNGRNGEEVVDLYAMGHRHLCTANVTGDSQWAIVKDVVRALDKYI